MFIPGILWCQNENELSGLSRRIGKRQQYVSEEIQMLISNKQAGDKNKSCFKNYCNLFLIFDNFFVFALFCFVNFFIVVVAVVVFFFSCRGHFSHSHSPPTNKQTISDKAHQSFL